MGEYHSIKGSMYTAIGAIDTLVISLQEWKAMRDQTLSPKEIMVMRTMYGAIGVDSLIN